MRKSEEGNGLKDSAHMKKEHDDGLGESSYNTRKLYLHTMKQFMAWSNTAIESPIDTDIEEYLRYEKRVSHHIQEILKQCG